MAVALLLDEGSDGLGGIVEIWRKHESLWMFENLNKGLVCNLHCTTYKTIFACYWILFCNRTQLYTIVAFHCQIWFAKGVCDTRFPTKPKFLAFDCVSSIEKKGLLTGTTSIAGGLLGWFVWSCFTFVLGHCAFYCFAKEVQALAEEGFMGRVWNWVTWIYGKVSHWSTITPRRPSACPRKACSEGLLAIDPQQKQLPHRSGQLKGGLGSNQPRKDVMAWTGGQDSTCCRLLRRVDTHLSLLASWCDVSRKRCEVSIRDYMPNLDVSEGFWIPFVSRSFASKNVEIWSRNLTDLAAFWVPWTTTIWRLDIGSVWAVMLIWLQQIAKGITRSFFHLKQLPHKHFKNVTPLWTTTEDCMCLELSSKEV